MVWTDGSCNNSPEDRVGAAACVLVYNGCLKTVVTSESNTSSARQELVAILLALQAVRPTFNMIIHSDSENSVHLLTGVKKPEKNTDITNKIFDILYNFSRQGSKVQFIHIPKDTHKYNRLCHTLANELRTQHKTQHETPVKLSKKKLKADTGSC